MTSPFQNALKFPATKPESTASEAPPSRAEATISVTWADLDEVKNMVNSGMTAAESVPSEIMAESFHHSPAPMSLKSTLLTAKVTTMDSPEVIQTKDVSGASKSKWSLSSKSAREIAPFTQ